MSVQHSSRNKPHEIFLSDDLSIRYTFHSLCVSKQGERSTVNELVIYLHSTQLKAQIGAKHRKQYQYTEKQKRVMQRKLANDPTLRFDAMMPSVQLLETAIVELLEKNKGMSEKQSKTYGGKEKSITLKQTALAWFWLKNMEPISNKYWGSTDEQVDSQRFMAHMLIDFGNLDLSLLGDIHTCKDRFALIRKEINETVGGGQYKRRFERILRESTGTIAAMPGKKAPRQDEDAVTNQMKKYSQVLWVVLETYLLQSRNTDIHALHSSYAAIFRNKPITSIGLVRNLVPKTLSREQYGLLYHELEQEMKHDPEQSQINIVILMVLFMGLSVEEVCALCMEDRINIPSYQGRFRFAITKEYRRLDNHRGEPKRRWSISDDLATKEQYRNVPIPPVIDRLIQDHLNRGTGPLFVAGNKRITPDMVPLQAKVSAILREQKTNLIVQSKNRVKKLPLSFNTKNCSRSIAHLWKLFGLQDNEIRYLLGMRQVDTAGKHYIDFNNPHKQYCMCTQSSYAMCNTIAEKNVAGTFNEQLCFRQKCQSAEIKGAFDRVRHTQLRIMQPVKIDLVSTHGMRIVRR